MTREKRCFIGPPSCFPPILYGNWISSSSLLLITRDGCWTSFKFNKHTNDRITVFISFNIDQWHFKIHIGVLFKLPLLIFCISNVLKICKIHKQNQLKKNYLVKVPLVMYQIHEVFLFKGNSHGWPSASSTLTHGLSSTIVGASPKVVRYLDCFRWTVFVHFWRKWLTE